MYRNQLSPTRVALFAMHPNLRRRELRICPVSQMSIWGSFPLRTVPQSVFKLCGARASNTSLRCAISTDAALIGRFCRVPPRQGGGVAVP